MRTLLFAFRLDESAVTAIEYSLIAALIAVAITDLSLVFNAVAANLAAATS
jgi:Flp pilus assembly pilin Flp